MDIAVEDLFARSANILAQARATREVITLQRRHSPVRRLIRLASGGSDAAPSDAERRSLARAAMTEGRIPKHAADSTWGGPGLGAPCTICKLSISWREQEIE